MNNAATIASNLVNVSSKTFSRSNLTLTSNTNFNNISSNTHLINNLDAHQQHSLIVLVLILI